jgi:hypothetical protein
MTRISGHHIVRTKCCKTFFSTLAYSSMNFSAREHWTYGATFGSLSPSTGGLCRCTCGGYFLIKDAEVVETVRSPKPLPPKDWNDDAPHFLMLPRETTQQYKNRMYDTRPIACVSHNLLARALSKISRGPKSRMKWGSSQKTENKAR